MSAAWMVATVALTLALAIALVGVARGSVPNRLAALPMVGTITTLVLATMSFAYDQSAAIDLALALALLSLPGLLVFALFEERWL